MPHPLAIVIPAWKPDFLARTLECLARQSTKTFRVYVGDDASPHGIHDVVRLFETRIEITYHRFESNLGGSDLVSHWERCIALTAGEPLLWLFSDDDLLSPECVENLLATWTAHPDRDLFHFDIDVVGENDEILHTPPRFPPDLTGLDFYRMRRDNRILSFAPEFVFTRRIHARHGFVRFDLAWGADLCTWILYAGKFGIATVPEGRVSWRRSRVNISPNHGDLSLLVRKISSEIEQMSWVRGQFRAADAEWTLKDEVRTAHAFCRNSLQHIPLSRTDIWWSKLVSAARTSEHPFAPLLYFTLAYVSAIRRRVFPLGVAK